MRCLCARKSLPASAKNGNAAATKRMVRIILLFLKF
jgi:hypothetical protein